jgi:hypothetical protein
MQTYLYLGLFVLFILQMVSLYSNNWYGKDNKNWGFYNSCNSNSCIEITTYGSDKVFLYICRILVWISILITVAVIFILNFDMNVKDKINILLYSSSIIMLIVVCMSIKFRSVNYFGNKIAGTPRLAFILSILASSISFGLAYLLKNK